MSLDIDNLWRSASHDFLGRRKTFFIGYAVLLAVLCFAALAIPERMFISTMTHDVVIFFDGIYRVGVGQIPHVDFASPLGPFTYYAPLAVSYLPGLEASLPDALAVVSILTVVFAAYMAVTRMNFTVGLLFVTLAALMVAAPVVPGSSTKDITFAMFYNRIGYGALMLMLAFLLPARVTVPPLIEGALIGMLGIVLLNIKITYFLAWLGILLIVMLLNPILRTSGAIALALVAFLAIALAAWMPDMYRGYLHDLEEASAAKLDQNILEKLKKNIHRHIIYFVVILWASWAVAKNTYQSKQSRILFVLSSASILIGSVVLFVMNAQRSFLVLPETMLLILAAMEYRNSATAPRISGLFLLLLLVALFKVTPELATRTSALNKYFKGARAQVDYPFNVVPELSDRFVIREQGRSLFASMGENGVVRVPELRALMMETGPRQEIYQEDYLYSVSQGVLALRKTMKQHGSGTVMTMDFSNPFSFLLGLRPPSGDYLWYHDGVNVSAGSIREAERLFADIRYVMVPAIPANLQSRDFLWGKFGDYVSGHYQQVSDDGVWDIWVRKA